MTKRAFIDVTPELLSQLLHLKEDIQVVSVVTRREHADLLRLHLRGDGLPDKTNCMEGECGHWLDDISEILATPAAEAATCVEQDGVRCANESISLEAWIEREEPWRDTIKITRSERVTIRLNIDDIERAIEHFKLSTSSKFFATQKPKQDAIVCQGGIDPAEERRKMEREFHERTCRAAHTASTLWEAE